MSRRRVVLFGTAALVGALVGVAAAVHASRGSSPAAATLRPDVSWAAGARRAPSFSLVDQQARPLTTSGLRGRPAIVSFIDPVCRNLCPLEAKALARVEHDLHGGVSLIAVSVNPSADRRATLRQVAHVWRLPAAWRWGLGPASVLARVWHDYAIGVQVQTKRLAGVRVSEVAHTEAAYVIDAGGYERALFVWPFRAADVERAIRSLG